MISAESGDVLPPSFARTRNLYVVDGVRPTCIVDGISAVPVTTPSRLIS